MNPASQNESLTTENEPVSLASEWRTILIACLTVLGLMVLITVSAEAATRGTGDLALVIERANGWVQVVETSGNSALMRIEGLGDFRTPRQYSRATSATPSCSAGTVA